MTFDMEPDHDEHARCRHEIHELQAEVERLRAFVRDQICACFDEYNNRLPTAPCQRCRLLGEAADAVDSEGYDGLDR